MELKKLLRISGEWQNHSLVSNIYIKHMSPKHYFNTPQWKFTLRFYSLSNGTNDSFVTYFKLSSSCAANTWSTQEPDWIKLAYSALIYLSGSSGGIYDIITWLNLTENPNKCITIKGARVQGWRSGESTRLPPMWPGFKSRRRRHMWVEFIVGSLPCSERFFSGCSGFPLSSKTNTSKFQFDLERTETFKRALKNSKVLRG